jgi:hypothetical protein
MRGLLVAFAVLLCSACALAELAPLHMAPSGMAVEGEYIVLMKPESSHEEWASFVSDVRLLFSSSEGDVINSWSIGDSFKALHIRSPLSAVQFLRAHPSIESIEENQIRTTQQCRVENNAIWNLQRLNAKAINQMDGRFVYDQLASSVDVYIIDTGVLTTHQEFGGRAVFGANFVNDGVNSDCNGHGTHVAGTVGGRTIGVARGATIFGVKVLSCQGSGTLAGVVSGIQWTADSAKRRNRKSVANMSLGGGYSAAENAAVAAAVDSGVVFAVAAGNENQNACNVSPASENKAITVGATYFSGNYAQDTRATFSNWGKCVDVLAPGQSIKSAWIGSNTAYNTISGTSMASPHVAGLAALVFANNPSYTATQVKNFILSTATPNVINLQCSGTCSSETPNKLIWSSRC